MLASVTEVNKEDKTMAGWFYFDMMGKLVLRKDW